MILIENKRLAVCRVISASPETVWEILIDTHLWPLWGPSLLDVNCKHRHIKLNSKGRVKTLFMFWVPFAITKFRHMEYWTWNIGPIKATGHTLTRKTEKSCELCFDMVWWAAFYIPVCWLALYRIDRIATK